MTKEKNKTKEVQEVQIYTVSEKFKKECKAVLENLPFSDVAEFVSILNKEELNELEVNSLLNYLGRLPYKNVVHVFALVKENIKPKE